MEYGVLLGLAACRIFIGILFVAAGVAKRRAGHAAFTAAIMGYDVLPRAWSRALARTLPPVEIALGVLLVAGVMSGVVALAAGSLLLVFCGAIAHSLVKGRRHHCGCIGFSAAQVREIQWHLVYRNLLLATLLAGIAAYRGGAFALDGILPASWSSGASLAPVLLALCGTAAIAIVTAHCIRLARRSVPS